MLRKASQAIPNGDRWRLAQFDDLAAWSRFKRVCYLRKLPSMNADAFTACQWIGPDSNHLAELVQIAPDEFEPLPGDQQLINDCACVLKRRLSRPLARSQLC
jgi:hypothetical protein